MSKERQQELAHKVEQLQARRGKLLDEKKGFEAKHHENAEKLQQAEAKRLEACRREALGEPNDRETIEREISTLTANGTGLEVLIKQKNLEVGSLNVELEPINLELTALVQAQERERLAAEIETIFQDGKKEVMQWFAREFGHNKRIAHLRSNYEADVSLKRTAYLAAERLENAKAGRYMEITFSREELAQIRKWAE